MRLIFTHEQADFDAIASMLGAYFLDEIALPILPRRMNRNVRAFVTLYGAELPFVDPRDLPPGPVESILLVDTQTMATIRGVGAETQVHVIDHHSLRSDIPSSWTMTTDTVGATTTLLVEQLRESYDSLSMIQATLLLLGIYEDTGSLTYIRTTSRDLTAASFLLEQGANLSIVSDFLNHPLSKSQQVLYDQLRKSVVTLDLHGSHILIASGEAQEMDEELSTVAHKLRDLLDPDALFVLVTTRSGVQLICRSTTDRIDVADIANYFGGGGHSRASASLIKRKALQDVNAELLAILPRYVRPAVTVAEIMSQGLQVLSPDTTVQEAALRMQRYGYEGYPVVQNGKVIGLLTRRAVDRALAHKLNLKVSSLMNAGVVAVKPEDSIEHLQRVMTDTGWGQVPVLHADGAIIGIVTRTDFLKTMAGKCFPVGHQNLAKQLEDVMPPARLALLKAVCEVALEQRTAIYVVGGFVRDLLLERPSLDFDLVVEGDAIALAHSLGRRFGGRVTTHARFGTAKWLINEVGADLAAELGYRDAQEELPDFLDLISARTEFYAHPTALPTVERGSIKLDLHRRDFTINTLAMRLDGKHYGELHDYWGGFSDLREELVRVLHSLSFVDDPTRMLRAVRFEQRFGFRIEERTLQLLDEALSLLGRVTGERIRHELDHMLDEENWLLMLRRLNDLGLMRAIHNELPWDETIETRLTTLDNIDSADIQAVLPGFHPVTTMFRRLVYTVWLSHMHEEQARSILSRIRYPASQMDQILASCRLFALLPTLTEKRPSQVVRLLDSFPRLAVYANYLAQEENLVREMTWRYLTEWVHVSPTITGNDLHSRGLPSGPSYRRILDRIRSAWLDGEISSPEDEAQLLSRLLDDQKIDQI